MVSFEAMASDLIDLLANSMFYEESLKYARDEKKNQAFRKSEETSDRRREADALEDPMFKLADKAHIKARAIRKEIEMRYDSAVRAHHSMKSLSKNQEQGRWLG